MPEKTVHPGSFVGDSIEEFKRLPTWGKVGAVGVLVVVGYLAIRAKNAANITGSPGMAGTPTTSGTQSPFPMVGNLPVLPPGVNPIFGPGGDVIGYQGPTAPPVTGQPPTPVGPPRLGPGPGGVNPNPAANNPLIPYGQYKGPSYSHLKPGTTYTYQNVTYLLSTGGGGRLYGTAQTGPMKGTRVLLYAPKSSYVPATATPHVTSVAPIRR